MATSKTLSPTGVTIQIPAFTDQPDQRVNSNCIDKEADAINALNDQIATFFSEVQSASQVTQGGGTATIAFPTGVTRSNIIIVSCYLFHNSNKYYGASGAEVTSVENDGIHVKNNGGASNYVRVVYRIQA